MGNSLQRTPTVGKDMREDGEQFDVIIIGAGVTGLYALYRLRELGLSVRGFEDGGGVGGTWYWNRYPGARFDSESETYGYSFSEELLQEWDWKEHYSGQPENERYLNYVADKFDLRRDIQFNARVDLGGLRRAARSLGDPLGGWPAGAGAIFNHGGWHLSAHYTPPLQGIESFKGDWCHTSRWPKEGMDFTGKRVAVIGTGATAVQLIPEIAKEVGHLTVFQRTANYCAPLRNAPDHSRDPAPVQGQLPGHLQEVSRNARLVYARIRPAVGLGRLAGRAAGAV